jgi:hypothetical protein
MQFCGFPYYYLGMICLIPVQDIPVIKYQLDDIIYLLSMV